MCFSKILVNALSPIPKIEKYDNFVFVGPHPDDIEIGAGATVKKLTESGKSVHYIIVTDGDCGTTDASVTFEKLAQIRKNEAIDAAKFLGVKSVTFLGYGDGGIYSADEAALKIAAELARLKAQIVFAPDPHLYTECHLDHIKTGYAAAQGALLSAFPLAVRKAGVTNASANNNLYDAAENNNINISASHDLNSSENSVDDIKKCCRENRNNSIDGVYAENEAANGGARTGSEATTVINGVFFYYTERPNFYFATKKCYKAQIDAVALHKSQFTDKTGNLNDDFKGISLYIKFRNIYNGLKRFKGHADCFRALSPLMMHCCAEKV